MINPILRHVKDLRPEGSPWTLLDAAKFLGVSSKSIERRIKANEIKVIKFGRLVRIPDDEVRRLAANGF